MAKAGLVLGWQRGVSVVRPGFIAEAKKPDVLVVGEVRMTPRRNL